MSNSINKFWAKTFESFINFDPIFEASTLSKTGMPDKMVTAIHKKAEHWDEYPRMAHTYRGGTAIPMPYKYHAPSHDIEISEPKVFTGKKTNVDPYSGREIKSFYTDFHWFIESLPFGQNRVLIANPDLDFYMYIYDKSKSKGATGMQYAILWWDKDRKRAVDFGYSELTTQAVDRSRIRVVHDTKGGNRSDKIQEFIRSATKEGEKNYAPSTGKQLYAYNLDVDYSGQTEPRATRKGRASSAAPVTSVALIDVFAERYKNILSISKDAVKGKFVAQVNAAEGYANPSAPVEELASSIEVDANQLMYFLFTKVRDFRKELYGLGAGAYSKTTGFELEAENKIADSFPRRSYAARYEVSSKTFSPDEERADPEQGFREAQPEKYRRSLPVAGEYASIPSIIKNHTLDGTLFRFLYYTLSGKINAPKVNILALLGIDPDQEDFTGLPDFETWTL